MYHHCAFIDFTKSIADSDVCTASKKHVHAQVIAQPKRGHIVASPAIKLLTTSLPALEVMIVFVAHDTAGP